MAGMRVRVSGVGRRGLDGPRPQTLAWDGPDAADPGAVMADQ